jgi:hypothetical protein
LHSGTFQLGAESQPQIAALGRKRESPSVIPVAGDGAVGVKRDTLTRGSSHRNSQSELALLDGSMIPVHPMQPGMFSDDKAVSGLLLHRNSVVNRTHRNYEIALQTALESQERFAHDTREESGINIITSRARIHTNFGSHVDENAFVAAAPLMGEAATIDSLPQPSMETILEHPVAVEVFKRELDKTSSVESLIFTCTCGGIGR